MINIETEFVVFNLHTFLLPLSKKFYLKILLFDAILHILIYVYIRPIMIITIFDLTYGSVCMHGKINTPYLNMKLQPSKNRLGWNTSSWARCT